MTLGNTIWYWPQMTYIQLWKWQGVSSFSGPYSSWLSYVECVRWPWAHVSVINGTRLVTIYETDLIWPTYSPESNKGSQVSAYMTDWDCHLWNMLCGFEHLFWRILDDIWALYLKLTSNDLLTALKVTRGLKFQWTWLNGTVTCKACEVALSTF